MAFQMTLGIRRLTDRLCPRFPLKAEWMTSLMALCGRRLTYRRHTLPTGFLTSRQGRMPVASARQARLNDRDPTARLPNYTHALCCREGKRRNLTAHAVGSHRATLPCCNLTARAVGYL